MAASSAARMRLTIEVLPLAGKTVHGQDLSLKARKFALPVQSDQTFEHVWSLIEHRYKTNYLDAWQTAEFKIHKLQDAYDCDLDLGDTVGAIFEGETDPAKRIIKVFPFLVTRDFSVPPTSNLRPGRSQKRGSGSLIDHARKRRRLEQEELGMIQEEVISQHDRPIASTETGQIDVGIAQDNNTPVGQATSYPRRSPTGESLIFVNNVQTGQIEFTDAVKGEPLDPSQISQTTHGLEQAELSPNVVAEVGATRSPANDSHIVFNTEPQPYLNGTVNSAMEVAQGEMPMPPALQASDEVTMKPSTAEKPTSGNQLLEHVFDDNLTAQRDAADYRPNVYDIPSSPDFLKRTIKSKKTYSRSPRSMTTIQNEVDLLNHSRSRIENRPFSPQSITKKSKAFRMTLLDDIESTPQEEAEQEPRSISHVNGAKASIDLTSDFLSGAGDILGNEPTNLNAKNTAKVGGLKKVNKKATTTPLSNLRFGVQHASAAHTTRSPADLSSPDNSMPSPSEVKKRQMDPSVQARLDKLNRLRRRTSPQAVIQPKTTETHPSPQSKDNGELPDSRKQITRQAQSSPDNNEAAADAPSKSGSVATQDTSRLSVQATPVAMPRRSPIPLPENVRRAILSSELTADSVVSHNKDDVFKKPAAKDQIHKSPVVVDGTTEETSGSVSSERRTFPRTEIPLPTNIRRPASTTLSDPARRSLSMSHSDQPSDEGRTHSSLEPRISKSKNQKHGSSEAAEVESPILSPPEQTQIKCNGASQTEAKSTLNKATSPPESSRSTLGKGNKKDQAVSISSDESSSDYSDPEDVSQQEGWPGQLHGKTSMDGDSGKILAKSEPNMILEDFTENQSKESASLNTQGAAAPLWGFENLDQVSGSKKQPGKATDMRRASESTPPILSARPSDPPPEALEDSGSKSSSASAAASVRSSPAALRRPARFLSRSPTPNSSESENDTEETSAAPSKAATPPTAIRNDSESDTSSSDSSSEDSSSNEEEQDANEEEAELPDSVINTPKDFSRIPSSPPVVIALPNSTPLVPETSQVSVPQPTPLPRKTPIPLPSSQPARLVPSSQQQATPSQQPARRPLVTRYSGFRTLREQLADTKTKTTTSQKTAYDPRMIDLRKLTMKGKAGGKGVGALTGVGGDDSSDEESSSSSSDSE